MYNFSYYKRKFYFTLIILLILGIGIGYAVLSQRLSVGSTVNYGSMKWDVGFDSVIDLSGNTLESNEILGTAVISNDKKSLSINCDIGNRVSQTDCLVKVTVKNGSSFDVYLNDVIFDISEFAAGYLNDTPSFLWVDSSNTISAGVGDILPADTSRELLIRYSFRELEAADLNSKGMSFDFNFEVEWIQYDGEVNEDESLIGKEISIGTEKFNVISDNGDTVTMLAQYNLGTNYRQTTTENEVTFSDTSGWKYTAENKEINIQLYAGNAKKYVNNYVSHLQEITRDTTLTGNLISLTELKAIGCTINDDYFYTNGLTCLNSIHSSWIINGQQWYTRSPNSTAPYDVWVVTSNGALSYDYLYSSIRPVITISKETLDNLDLSVSLISFAVGGVTYYAEEGMTIREWVNSSYSDLYYEDEFFIGNCYNLITTCIANQNGAFAVYSPAAAQFIHDGAVIDIDQPIISGFEYSLGVISLPDDISVG